MIVFFVVNCDYRRNSAARSPVAFERQAKWLADLYKVIQDAVCDIFVEDALVAKFLQIKLETLQFDAHFSGNVAKDQCPKVGLTGFGANRCELGAGNLDLVLSVGKTILENLELVLKRSGHRRKFLSATKAESVTGS